MRRRYSTSTKFIILKTQVKILQDECIKQGEKQCESMGSFSGSCYPVIEELGPDIYGAMHYGQAPSTVCEFLGVC